MLNCFFFGVVNQYVYITFIFIFPNKPSTWYCSCHSFCFCNVVNEKKINYETDLSVRNWLDVEKRPLNLQNNGTARWIWVCRGLPRCQCPHLRRSKVKFICWSISMVMLIIICYCTINLDLILFQQFLLLFSAQGFLMVFVIK